MGAIDRFLRRGRRQEDYKPMMKRLEAAMLAACRAAGASAWYIPDDFLVLGPELVTNGNFDAGLNGWTNTNAVASIVSDQASNVLSLSAAGGGSSLNQYIPLEVGKSYLFSYKRRGINAGSGLAGRLSILYSDATALTFPASTVTVRSDYEFVQEVQTITKPVTSFKLLATLASADSVGTVYYDNLSVKEVISAKDYQDSVGTLPAYLGGTVGMIFDAAGVTGPELIANPHTSAIWVAEGTTPPTAVNGADSYLGKACRSVTFPVIASGGYGVCRARDAESIFNVVTGTTYSVSFEYALSRDLTTGESVAIAVTGSSGLYAKSVSAGAPGGVWCSGSGGQPAVASGGGTGLRPYATMLNSPLTVYIRALSVKVSGGVVAVQSTAGNRPTISRMPRKLGPEMLSSVTISGTNGTNTGAASGSSFTINQVDSTSVVTATLSIQAPSAGKSYLVSSTPSALSGQSFKVDSPAWAGGPTTVSAGFVLTAPSNPSAQIQIYRVGFPAVGTFSNISVREVLEWSYALTFDGSNDSLAVPASVIGATLTQPYTMIQAFRAGAAGTAQRAQGDTARWSGIGSSNKLVATHAGGATQGGTSDVLLGDLVVAEYVWDGSTIKIYRNGILEVSTPMAAPTGVTPGAHNIGQNGGGTYFKGDLVLDLVCPAVMTDAQRAAVRKFAAAQMGMAL